MWDYYIKSAKNKRSDINITLTFLRDYYKESAVVDMRGSLISSCRNACSVLSEDLIVNKSIAARTISHVIRRGR